MPLLSKDFVSNFAAQFAHASAGYIAVTKARQYGGHKWAAIITVIGVVLAAIKEFYIDYVYEDKITRGSSPLDFGMYCAGMAVGWFV